MTDVPPRASGLTRRLMLSALASLAPIGAGRAAAPAQSLSGSAVPPPNLATSFPTDVTVVVAGPEGGAIDGWARAVLEAMGRSLPNTRLHAEALGAADGVTGANRFETRTAPDGSRLLIVPGAALLAWLVGDPRAQFDIGHWVPIMAGTGPGVVALRGGPAALRADRKLRIAAASPGGAELAALLGVDLLGAVPVMVPGVTTRAAMQAALADGRVDGVLLRGGQVPEQAAAVAAVGAAPLFTLGQPNEAGPAGRDPLFPDVPHFTELLAVQRPAAASSPLFAAWCAIAAATRLEFAVVLPQLTPATMVAQWRRAGADAAPSLVDALGAQTVRPLGGAAGAAAVSAVAVDASTLLELRRWLGARLDWHPS